MVIFKTMKTQLIILEQGNVLVSDEKEKVQSGIWYYEIDNHIPVYQFTKDTLPDRYYLQKVLASDNPKHNLPSINYNGLEDKFGIIDVEKLAEKNFKKNTSSLNKISYEIGFEEGFEICQSLNDKKFSLEDMENAYNAGENYGYESSPIEPHYLDRVNPTFIQFIEKLQQPKIFNVEVEMETMYHSDKGDRPYPDETCQGHYLQPKITNSSIKITKIL